MQKENATDSESADLNRYRQAVSVAYNFAKNRLQEQKSKDGGQAPGSFDNLDKQEA